MADELPPPKRDVNEVFTLDASDPTSDPDGPLAHLMSESPVAEPDRTSIEPAVDDDGAAPDDAAADRDLPDIADVGGLEDFYVTTTELQLGAPLEKPLPTPVPPSSTGAAEPETTDPAPEAVDVGDVVEPARSVWEVQNLRFSTEAGHRFELPPDGRRQAPAPAPPPASAPPPPVSPGKSVRVPGQDRRRAVVPIVFEEITERRWFWGMMAGVIGIAVLGLMAAGDLLPTLSATDPADVVVDDGLPSAPAVVEETETSAVDTSSSTGAATFGLDPSGPTTSVASSTTVPTTTARRRVTTTQAPTITSTVSSTTITTTTVASSTTAASSTTPSTPTTASTTTTVDPTTTTADPTTTTTADPTTTPEETTTTTTDGG